MNPRPALRVVLAMDARTRRDLLPPALVGRLREAADVDPDVPVTDFADPRHAARLAACDVLLTGWGVPVIDDAALERMPRLRAVVHGAGSVRGFVGDGVFDRGVQVSSAAGANALPVAEFTVAAIIFAAKRVARFARAYRENRSANALDLPTGDVGTNGLVVGVIGASRIGRRVMDLLRPLDVRVLVSDPTIDAQQARRLGAELVEIDAMMRRAIIVTVHAPNLPSTRHLIDGARLALLRDGATVINTARGALIDTDALTAEVSTGRIDAVLDVTDPEPLPVDSPLFDLPNVLLTPHIAGSLGNEVARLGEWAVAEVERLAAGLPLAHPVARAELEWLA